MCTSYIASKLSSLTQVLNLRNQMITATIGPYKWIIIAITFFPYVDLPLSITSLLKTTYNIPQA
jgi:hypothetical protein